VGEDAYLEDGNLNKPVLSKFLYESKENQEKIGALVHPRVRSDFEMWCNFQDSEVVFMESAILYESGFDRECDYVVAVIAPKTLRIARTMARDNRSEEEVKQRIKAQMSNCQLLHRVHYVVENNGKQTIETLVDKLIRHLKKQSIH
jgi:dephospho-CoA kinase